MPSRNKEDFDNTSELLSRSKPSRLDRNRPRGIDTEFGDSVEGAKKENLFDNQVDESNSKPPITPSQTPGKRTLADR